MIQVNVIIHNVFLEYFSSKNIVMELKLSHLAISGSIYERFFHSVCKRSYFQFIYLEIISLMSLAHFQYALRNSFQPIDLLQDLHFFCILLRLVHQYFTLLYYSKLKSIQFSLQMHTEWIMWLFFASDFLWFQYYKTHFMALFLILNSNVLDLWFYLRIKINFLELRKQMQKHWNDIHVHS